MHLVYLATWYRDTRSPVKRSGNYIVIIQPYCCCCCCCSVFRGVKYVSLGSSKPTARNTCPSFCFLRKNHNARTEEIPAGLLIARGFSFQSCCRRRWRPRCLSHEIVILCCRKSRERAFPKKVNYNVTLSDARLIYSRSVSIVPVITILKYIYLFFFWYYADSYFCRNTRVLSA